MCIYVYICVLEKMLLCSRFYARAASSHFSISRKCCNHFCVVFPQESPHLSKTAPRCNRTLKTCAITTMVGPCENVCFLCLLSLFAQTSRERETLSIYPRFGRDLLQVFRFYRHTQTHWVALERHTNRTPPPPPPPHIHQALGAQQTEPRRYWMFDKR